MTFINKTIFRKILNMQIIKNIIFSYYGTKLFLKELKALKTPYLESISDIFGFKFEMPPIGPHMFIRTMFHRLEKIETLYYLNPLYRPKLNIGRDVDITYVLNNKNKILIHWSDNNISFIDHKNIFSTSTVENSRKTIADRTKTVKELYYSFKDKKYIKDRGLWVNFNHSVLNKIILNLTCNNIDYLFNIL